jgi:23S rRNA pseudouridine2605 synthase
MFQAVGHPVAKLKRVAIGPISDPKLTPGVWRELTKAEVKMLATNQEPKKTPRRTTKRPAAARPKPASKKKAATSAKKPATRRSTAAKPKGKSAARRG